MNPDTRDRIVAYLARGEGAGAPAAAVSPALGDVSWEVKRTPLGDAVLIESEAIALGAASWRMRQRALRDGELLAEVTPKIGFVGPDGRPRRHPAPWRAAFETVLAHRMPDE